MFRRFFNPEGLLWKPLGYLGELVILSLLWVVCSILLVTIGPATAALYDCTVHCVRRKETDLFYRFFHTFRAELKTGILSTLLWAALFAFPILLYRGLTAGLDGAALSPALPAALIVCLFFLLAVAVWVIPTLSRFTFDFAGLNRTALRLAFGNILRSVAMVPLVILGFAVSYLLVAPAFVAPGVVALLCSYLIEPVFRRYTDVEQG